MNLDQCVMAIIAFAGDSQSYSRQAIEAARNSRFDEAGAFINEAKENALRSHQAHTELLTTSAANELQVNFLMVHASNHLSVAEMLITMAELFIELSKRGKKNA